MKKHSVAAALVSAALLFAAAPAGAAQPTGKTHTLTGWVVADDSIDPLAPGCAGEPLWRYNAVGEGEFSHLGDVHYSMTHCTYGPSFPPATGTFEGTSVIVADNGDELYMTYSGAFHIEITASGPVSVVDPMTWTITGGTGRFLNATGSGSTHALGDIVNSTTSGTWSGTIAYTASDRADR